MALCILFTEKMSFGDSFFILTSAHCTKYYSTLGEIHAYMKKNNSIYIHK